MDNIILYSVDFQIADNEDNNVLLQLLNNISEPIKILNEVFEHK